MGMGDPKMGMKERGDTGGSLGGHWDHWGGIGILGGHWGTLGNLWGALGSSGGHWDPLGNLWRILWEMLGDTGGHWDPLGDTGILWGDIGILWGHWDPLGSAQEPRGDFWGILWGPLGSFGGHWDPLGDTGILCWDLGSSRSSSPNPPFPYSPAGHRHVAQGAAIFPAEAAMFPYSATLLPFLPEAALPLSARAGLRGRTGPGRGLRASAAIPPPSPGSAAPRRRHDGADDPARHPEGPQRLGDPDRHHAAVPRHDPVRLAGCAPQQGPGEPRGGVRGCSGGVLRGPGGFRGGPGGVLRGSEGSRGG